MNVLFAHDHRFIDVGDSVWSACGFDGALWRRYLEHFDHLTVVGRQGDFPAGATTAQMVCSSAPGVRFAFFEDLSNLSGLTLRRPSALRQMCKLVSTQDAVIARLPSDIGLLAIAAARSLDKPWAVEVVGCPRDDLTHYGSLRGRIYAPLAQARMRRAVSDADHVLYVTRTFLQSRYPTHAKNTAAVSDVAIKEMSRDILDSRLARIDEIPTRQVKLGLIGSLRVGSKGLHTLLTALAQARPDLPPISLHILGAGDQTTYRQTAERLAIADLVKFDGCLRAGAPVLNWLDGIDLYLQPSFQEGLPRGLIEAMSRGCPAIASTAGGIPELLPAEDLIAPGDAPALAQLLTRRLTDQAWMRERACMNWQAAQEYRDDFLDKRRSVFWHRFRNAIIGKAAGECH